MMESVTVFGLGKVGSQIAYQLAMDNHFGPIYLIESDEKTLEGHYNDLVQSIEVYNSDSYMQYGNDRLVCPTKPIPTDFYIICAGTRIEHGNDRTLLFNKNKDIVEEILTMIAKVRKEDSITFMVTNPSTELTKLALDYIPNVLPVGNKVDNARLRLTKVSGSHEKPKINEQYKLVKDNKGYTNFAVTTEVMEILRRFR
ncbi:MAG: hypothetical protein DRN81_02110 [Thermoproteota archaeon]|nr:MAG: hypothetical protein DRN81_02110 [Candidatus Korarchaeota archaeon]